MQSTLELGRAIARLPVSTLDIKGDVSKGANRFVWMKSVRLRAAERWVSGLLYFG